MDYADDFYYSEQDYLEEKLSRSCLLLSDEDMAIARKALAHLIPMLYGMRDRNFTQMLFLIEDLENILG